MSFRDSFDTMSNTSKQRVLDALGLEAKPDTTDYILPALGVFGAGLIVGAVVGLMVAPKPGTELRQDIRHSTEDWSHKIQERAQSLKKNGSGEEPG